MNHVLLPRDRDLLVGPRAPASMRGPRPWPRSQQLGLGEGSSLAMVRRAGNLRDSPVRPQMHCSCSCYPFLTCLGFMCGLYRTKIALYEGIHYPVSGLERKPPELSC